ncbi:hypothetical protein QUC31_017403 [Theobroma cacao]
MNSRRFSSSPLPLHLISVLVIAGIPLSLSTPELYRNCSDAEFKCGVMEILGVRCQVLDILWERRTLRIAREDFKNDLCSPQIENSILDSMLFKFVNATAYANVTLLYDCPHAQVLPSNDPFICNGAKYKNVSVVPGDTDRGPCSASVMVPIPQTSLTKIGNSTLLLAALKTEFEVEWKVDTQACQKCERSGGACGFMKWDVLNVCYCPNPNPNKDWQDLTECHPPISPSVSPPSGATQAQVRIPQSLGNPDGYSACRDPRFECGGISIGYPFSGDGIPPGCGHPGLQLYCENNIVTIEILDVRYQVLRIGEDNQTLQIARKDFMTDFCHPQFESSAFDSTLFNIFPGYTNVALFYDCTSAIPQSIGSYDCNGSHRNVSIIPSAFIREVCARNITVPISETSLQRNANSASLLEEALKTGFEVELKVDSKACQKCRDTGGTCGFDFQNHTNCYCLNDPGLSLKECPPPPPSQANTAEQVVPGCKLHREGRSLTMLKGLSNPAELGSGKVPTTLCVDDLRYSNCSTIIRCGSLANIGYPFWGMNRASYCGQPGFELKCEDGVGKITMSQNTLRILDVNPDQQILKVAREDYWDGYCPRN